MNLKSQKRIAAQILKVGENRVWFDPDRLQEIKESITKADIKSLIRNLAIQAKPQRGTSRFRARKSLIQKRKGQRKGQGSRKGKKTARFSDKKRWMNKIRVQRGFLKLLRAKVIITPNLYAKLYRMAKGNHFRSKRHIRLYLEENRLVKNEKKDSTEEKKKITR